MGSNPKILKILSIDGGGIKGLYSASVLAVLENHFEKKVIDCFDLICGTSTGGLIALALSIDLSAKEVVEIYKENANLIFPYNQNFSDKNLICNLWGQCRQAFGVNKYDNEGLKKALEKIFQDKQMRDAKVNLCIPSVDIVNGTGRVFKTGHCDEYKIDPPLLMKDIALATTAAPTYFPPIKVDSLPQLFIDGGIWANNPSLVGLTEALKCFVGPDKDYEDFSILSLASVSPPVAYKKPNSLTYLKNLISTILNIQSKQTEEYLKLLSKSLNFKYIRIPEPSLTLEDMKILNLDSSKSEELNKLEGLGHKMGSNYCNDNNVKQFFKEKRILEGVEANGRL